MKLNDKFKNEDTKDELPLDPMEHNIIDSELVPSRAFEIDDRENVNFYLDPRDKNAFIRFLFSRLKRHYEINYNTSVSNFSEIYDDDKEFPKEAKLMSFEEMLVITREFQNRVKEIQHYVNLLFEEKDFERGKLKLTDPDEK